MSDQTNESAKDNRVAVGCTALVGMSRDDLKTIAAARCIEIYAVYREKEAAILAPTLLAAWQVGKALAESSMPTVPGHLPLESGSGRSAQAYRDILVVDAKRKMHLLTGCSKAPEHP